MSQTIVGIKKTKSTNGDKTYFNYYYQESFSDYDCEHAEALQGVQTGTEFSYTDIGCKVGDVVEFEYTKGFQGKATLKGCKIIKAADQPIGKK